MNKEVYFANLMEVLEQLNSAERHLKISFDRCKGNRSERNEDQLIEFEALTGRFARLVDMLIHKVYRAIDMVELTEGGTLIDVLNRAEKRGLIDTLSEMRKMKDMRNEIAYEYITERLQLLHEEIFQKVPKLLDLVERVQRYSKRYENQ